MIFIIERKTYQNTIEVDLIELFCSCTEHSFALCDSFPKNINISLIVPIGSVEWCENKYQNVRPNYYPLIFCDFYKRNIWKTSFQELKYLLLEKKESFENTLLELDKLFIKPANQYKKWHGKVISIHEEINCSVHEEHEEIYCSETVDFHNEWRLYISQGEVICFAWYDGQISNEELLQNGPPSLLQNSTLHCYQQLKKIISKEKISGIIDVGEAIVHGQREFIIVETCHPYAFGWYFDDVNSTRSNMYGKFLIDSDRYMTSI